LQLALLCSRQHSLVRMALCMDPIYGCKHKQHGAGELYEYGPNRISHGFFSVSLLPALLSHRPRRGVSVLLGIGGGLALVPFGGLLVSIREAKNSGFTSRGTADLHPDRQAFSSETTRNGDCRQPQHIKWPGVVQHLEFLRPVSIRIPQIGNLERRDRRRRS